MKTSLALRVFARLCKQKRVWIVCIALLAVLFNSSDPLKATAYSSLDSFVIPAKRTPTALVNSNANKHLNVVIEQNDTYGSVVQQQFVNYNQAIKLLENKLAKRWLTQRLQVGKELTLVVNSDNNYLENLSLQIDPNSRLQAKWIADKEKFVVSIEEQETQTEQVYIEGTITRSLFEDASAIGLPAAVITAFANIFAWDIDFANDVRTGDTFHILYEKKYHNGEQIPLYNILVAEFINRGKTITAVGFDNGKSKNYYLLDGKAMKKRFLRMPVKFGRISSHYNLRRVHPLFGTIRPHRGTDYAAARHTPIHSIGKGRIQFRGWQKGYGRTVIVNHGGGITTLYAHMQAYKSNQRVGSVVRQGQVIGYVGSSGYSTGPHVHMEFKVHGVHKNPAKIKSPKIPSLKGKKLAEFAQIRDMVMNVFTLRQQIHLATNAN